jgi:hypothetical protein
MTLSDYITIVNDPRRSREPLAYRVRMTPQEIAFAQRLRFDQAAPPPRPAGQGRPERRSLKEREEQEQLRRRLARHQADAEHDRVVRRLRNLR